MSGQLQSNSVYGAMLITINGVISTSNHMFRRAIWDKLLKCIFESSEISKCSKITRVIYPQKSPKPNMWLLVNHNKTNKRFVLKLISFSSGQLQITQWAITEGNYKLIPLILQCRLRSIVWLMFTDTNLSQILLKIIPNVQIP